jgi:hypothetical protein
MRESKAHIQEPRRCFGFSSKRRPKRTLEQERSNDYAVIKPLRGAHLGDLGSAFRWRRVTAMVAQG